MTYEIKSKKSNVKNYVFSSTAAVGVKTIPPQTKSKSISATVKKKNVKKVAKKAQVSSQTKAKANVAVREAKPNVHTVKSATVIPLPLTIISVAVVCTILFMVMVMTFVRINEYTVINDKLEFDVSQLEKSYILSIL